ncbi:hypothetical protein [Anaeromyxobacter terrae]|uniref:hypothetical protein n=1 Tax=Anaeromyxobacter terrae TaxID=2925406 RepID=UPI001F56C552|nr:hypothetical protein [Anaeromyxobacter sp. SG22]
MVRALFVGVVLAGLAVADVARAGGGNDQGGSTPFCQPINGSYCASINVFGCAFMDLPKPPPECSPENPDYPNCLDLLAPVGGNFFEVALLNALERARGQLCYQFPTLDGGNCSITGFEVIRQGALLSGPIVGCKAGEYRVDLRVWYLKPSYQDN